MEPIWRAGPWVYLPSISTMLMISLRKSILTGRVIRSAGLKVTGTPDVLSPIWMRLRLGFNAQQSIHTRHKTQEFILF